MSIFSNIELNNISETTATKKRLDDFLENYEFYSNSIEFRIISSKALERFKNVQSFQLNEIKNGRYKFNKSRRELLLLKFDLLTKVLNECENLCIQFHNQKIASADIVNSVVFLLTKASDLYTKIIKEYNPEAFDQPFSHIWLEMFNINERILIKRINDCQGLDLPVFFDSLVNSVIILLQNSTFELFELDVICTKQHPHCINNVNIVNNLEIAKDKDYHSLMLVVSNYVNSNTENSRYYLKAKIEIFIKYFEVKSIFLKNLSDHSVKSEVIADLESHNIKIDFKGSLSA